MKSKGGGGESFISSQLEIFFLDFKAPLILISNYMDTVTNINRTRTLLQRTVGMPCSQISAIHCATLVQRN